MNLENLTPETIEKAKACKTAEELLDLAKEEGVKLTLEQLEQISAGDIWGEAAAPFLVCPYCGSWNMAFEGWDGDSRYYRCKVCGYRTYPERLSGAPSHYQLYDP